MQYIGIKMLLLGFLLATASCSSKQKDRNAKQAGLYFGAGTQALMDQDYTAALTNLLKANELEPNSSEIITNLGMAYYFKGEKDIAIKHLQRALKLNDKNSDARINLASISYETGNVDEAERLYKQVLRDLTYDKQARTYYNLALIELESRANPKQAEAYLRQSLKEDINYCPAHLKLGMIQYNRRQYNQALTTFKEAGHGTCYESPAPHYYQAMAMIGLGRIDDARLKLEEVSTRFGKDTFAAKSRAKLAELNENQQMQYNSLQTRAPRKVLESPEF